MSGAASDRDATSDEAIYRLILFVAGREPNSEQARTNLANICGGHLEGRCDIEVVDVLTDYRTALEHNILVTPCLLKLEPNPRALVAGTLRDTEKVRTALQLPNKAS